MLIVAQLLQTEHERLPHRHTPPHRAISRAPGNQTPRRAGVDELLRHGPRSSLERSHGPNPVSRAGCASGFDRSPDRIQSTGASTNNGSSLAGSGTYSPGPILIGVWPNEL